jgi:hypothetical protein
LSFSLDLNHSQSRLAADRLAAVAGGRELNGSIWSNTWIDPVTETLMLRPVTLDTEWYLQSTGAYAKWGLADFVVSSDWEERQDQHWKGPWLAVKSSALNPAAITTASYPKNMGLSFSWFSYGSGDTFLQFKLGWNSVASDAAGVALHLWSDGRVDVYKDGAFIDSGKISGARSREVRRLQVFEMMVIPMRGRELLIVSASGDGFSVVFNELAADDPDPVITPAGKVWFKCESGATQVQIAPLRYATSGYTTSLKTSFLEPPGLDEPLVNFTNANWLTSPAPYKIYGFPGFGAGIQTASATLVEWDGATAFVPNGSRNEVRIRAQLSTTDNRFSPFVTGVQVGYAAVSGLTSGAAQVDLAAFVGEARLSVPDRGIGVALDVGLVRLTDLGLQPSVSLRRGSAPVRLRIDSSLVMEGFASAADLTDHGTTESGRVTIRDRWAMLDEAVFGDRIPLDGLPFEQAIELLVEKSGLPKNRVLVSSSGPILPFATGEKSGEWGMLVEAGDRAGDWLRRLMDTFAADWFYGFRPAPDGSGEQFFALPVAELSLVPAVTLGAERSGGPVYRRVVLSSIEPQANEVRVTGIDPRTGRPMQSVMVDATAQSVGSLVGSRPDSWSGSIRRFTLVDAGLTAESAIDAACRSLFAALSVRQELVEFESEYLERGNGVPVWRGDVVRLTGIGDVRIRSFGARFRHEALGGVVRRAVYTGVLLNEV